MRKLEGVVKEVVDEMAYLQRREARMRDTNGLFLPSLSLLSASSWPVAHPIFLLSSFRPAESTNARVQSFALITLVALLGLGVWQVRSFYLAGGFIPFFLSS